MTLRRAIEVVMKLAEKQVIDRYAITGAVAALNYIQPTLTEDLDVLISIDGFEKRVSGLLLLGPIDKMLAQMGYTERTGLGYMIEDWPVQFLPVASPLDDEALEQAEDVNIADPGDAPMLARILRAEHLVANAVKVGRLKDLARAQEFLEQKAVDLERLKGVLERNNLMTAWSKFCINTAIKNPFATDR
jgi:hypothetical protein